jgi:predicted phosphate transport protein (TIGR00153 family)
VSRFRLIPREEKFFTDFLAMADQLQIGARLLEEMLAVDPPDHSRAEEIKEVEHKCDYLTHEIIQRLNKTFVTPIDREDIHSMAKALDDVMDSIDDVATLIPMYRIEKLRGGTRELARLITLQTAELRVALEALEKREQVLGHVVNINDHEAEADRIHQEAVGALFDEERDPIMVMKWKEIFDMLEDATDRCEDVANLLENIVVKHG